MSATAGTLETRAAAFCDCFGQLRADISRVFVGQPAVVEQLLVCFFCQGHALIEGAPGLGKTLLVRTLSDALDLRFSRVQCTPDLMPADIIGTNVLQDGGDAARTFTFERGPIFANVVLADELNRATPRTQSAFLEAMQDRQVTVFGTSHALPDPFSVFATQNPIEMDGTYPLPEAQLDRFFFRVGVGAPGAEDLAEILARTTNVATPQAAARFDGQSVRAFADLIRSVKIAAPVVSFVVAMVRGTHPDAPEAPPIVRKYVKYGSSPRGAQAMVLGAKARALLAGRFHVATEDVRRVAEAALNHRIIRNFQAELDRVPATAIVEGVLAAAGPR